MDAYMIKNYNTLKMKILDVQTVIDLYYQYNSSVEVAKILNVNDRTVRRYLHNAGISLRSHRKQLFVAAKLAKEESSKVSRMIDRTGQSFNAWKVLNYAGKNFYGRHIWKVQCKCGFEKECVVDNIVSGASKCCSSCSIVEKHHVYDGFLSPQYYKYLQNLATRRSIDFLLSREYLEELLAVQNFKCKLSGDQLTFGRSGKYYDSANYNISLDRVDSSKAYVVGNVQWVTKNINFMKRTLSNTDFINLCKQVANNN